MAPPTLRLIRALRDTARRLATEATAYRWSHFGQCNCGQLAQTLTGLPARELYSAANEQPGDWAEQALMHASAAQRATEAVVSAADYGDRPALDEGAWQPEDRGACPVAEMPMSAIFATLINAGLSGDDIAHLERLSDPRIRKQLGTNTIDFPYGDRLNVVRYLDAWADLLQTELEAERLGAALDEPRLYAAAE